MEKYFNEGYCCALRWNKLTNAPAISALAKQANKQQTMNNTVLLFNFAQHFHHGSSFVTVSLRLKGEPESASSSLSSLAFKFFLRSSSILQIHKNLEAIWNLCVGKQRQHSTSATQETEISDIPICVITAKKHLIFCTYNFPVLSHCIGWDRMQILHVRVISGFAYFMVCINTLCYDHLVSKMSGWGHFMLIRCILKWHLL